jgi:hypothetical protein
VSRTGANIATTLTLTLALSVTALTLWFGGLRGEVYLALYCLTLIPGLPVGWMLFGRRQPAGWVAGLAIGYGLTALAFWVPVRLGNPQPWEFALAWLLLTAAIWWRAGRSREPLVTLPDFTTRDFAIWLLVLHLVLAFLALPFGRLGSRDTTGTRYYRAYFTADFVWHAALTQELARFASPPRNPYFARDPVHYYWTYFQVPAVVSGPERSPIVSVETALKINATGAALLMFSLVFFAAWSACGRGPAAGVASVIALVAPSFEGAFKILEFLRRGIPLDRLRDLNIDAITAWDFHGLRIDGLLRSMWYTPQHSTSLALGLVAVLVASRLASSPRALAFLLTGLALGLSVTMNPLLGAAFCAIYGSTLLYDLAARRIGLATIAQQGLTVLPVALALGWCLANKMGEGAGTHLSVGWLYDARNAPVLTLFLSLGGLLLPASVGCWPRRTVPMRPAFPAIPAAVVGLVLLYLVTLTDRSWVGFRAGNILQVTLPMLVARGLVVLDAAGNSRIGALIVSAVLLAGAPTTLVDTYNAQDISNLRMGPGFPWTITLSPAQQAGLEWIRESTRATAVVQADSVVRDRKNWSIIPTFAGRRMAAGQELPLLPEPQHQGAAQRIHALLTRLSAEPAHAEARALGIEYFWFDGDDEAAAERPSLQRFASRPDLFTQEFARGDVTVFRVN